MRKPQTVELWCPEHMVGLSILPDREPFSVYRDGTPRVDIDWSALECVPFVLDTDQDRSRTDCRDQWAMDCSP